MSSIDVRSLLIESLRIGSILFISYTIGAVINGINEIAFFVYVGDYVREGVILSGTAIAILFVLLRSVALSRTIHTTQNNLTPTTQEFVREAVVLAVPVVIWFTIAGLSMVLQSHSTFNSTIETIELASTRTGILTASLYVLFRGLTVLPTIEFSGNENTSPDD
ncbi:hypothetical protein [Haloarcula sebkhae]|uniref:Uncharacterized protein n=2 Tax=Haloarcula sebkhae TaxID=932660 RepID=A0A830EXE3_9EURY|nr:hypothetical protein [Haloarcula sebkhae]GGK84521.1 hypothetical protein GCM10009067_40860 [Haloarcula sebkhae]